MPLRILIVDDHAEFRRHARRMLESDGHDVIGEAPDSASAVERARALRPDVVLLDVNLPDGSGLQIVDRLCPPGSSGPAIVLTSTRAERDLEPLLRRSHARGFIPKQELSGSRIQELAG
ncbi:MAG: response regulator transcription factor [Solirubrobacteraceae bacterium]